MASAHKKLFYSIYLVLLYNTFYRMAVTCFTAEHNIICQFFFGPVHYYNSHSMSMEVIDSSASIYEM